MMRNPRGPSLYSVALAVIIWIILGLFLVYPLLAIGKNAFIVEGRISLSPLFALSQDPLLIRITRNSLSLAFGVSLVATIIAIPIALLLAHRQFTGRRIILLLLAVPLLLPPFIGVIGLRQILGRFGSVNLLLLGSGIISEPIDWLPTGSAFAVGILQVLHLYPVVVAQLLSSFEQQPASLHEAARSVGATPLARLFRVTLPLALPSIISSASLTFVASFTDLGTPLLFEYRAVLPVQIFNLLTDLHENTVGYALVFVVASVSLLMFAISDLFTRAHHSERSVREGATIARQPLRGWRFVAVLLPITIITALSILPHIGIILIALSERWFFTVLPESFTLSHLNLVFSHPLTLIGMRTSISLALISTLLIIILGATIGWLVVRSVIPGRRLLSLVALSPLAIPGMLFAFGYLGAFSQTILDSAVNPLPLLAIAYTVRRLPFMLRIITAGLAETSISYEEAARSVGASPLAIARCITIPLLRRYVIAGAILCFAFGMVEVSDSLILAREEKFYPIAKVLYALTARPDGIEVASALGTIVMCVSALLLGAARLVRAKR
jgi:iron(III) transport system permease protein